MPSDTNPYGGIFGGWLMSQMALAAGSLASRHSKGKAVVVAATDLQFQGAMEVGDELSVYASLEREGTTSMTIRARAVGRERDGEQEQDDDLKNHLRGQNARTAHAPRWRQARLPRG